AMRGSGGAGGSASGGGGDASAAASGSAGGVPLAWLAARQAPSSSALTASGGPERRQPGNAGLHGQVFGQGQNGRSAGRHAAEAARAARAEQGDQLLQAGVVADQQDAAEFAVLVGDLDQAAGRGVVDARLLAQLGVAQQFQHGFAGLAGAPGRRAQHPVGQE